MFLRFIQQCAASLIAGVVLCVCSPALSQPLEYGVSPIEAYLEDHDLRWALATQLRVRMQTASAESKLALADRLGKVYVTLIDQSTTPSQRARLETLGKQLLSDVPNADSFDLRLSLARAQYKYAEDIAVLVPLNLADPVKLEEAVKILNETLPVFRDVATKSHRRAELIERKLESISFDDERSAKAQLAEAQRLRSIATYYAGWSSYYLSVITKNPRLADDALRHFGRLLNANDGKFATIDRAPTSFFRLDHVARAAMGAGLCESSKGNTRVALRWLDLVENNEEISDDVRSQVFLHRVSILSKGQRWADLDSAADRHRKAAGMPLNKAMARFICVSALEALGSRDTPKLARPLVERIASNALGDLVQLGEVGQILDLVRTYGSAQLGDDGFIVRYVRGLVKFEDAKQVRIETNESIDMPTHNRDLQREFSSAADILVSAIAADDADDFAALHAGAGLMAGIAMFQSNELPKASSHLEKTFHLYPDADSSEETLWLAIVSLDLDSEQSKIDHSAHLSELAAIFLAQFPAGERAARLVMRDENDSLIDMNRALEVLLGVPSSSNLYMSAQQQASKLLYKQYRTVRGSERDVAAMRFLSVAERVLDQFRRRMADEDRDLSRAAAANSVVLVRQMLDVVTGMPTPDTARAKSALAILESLRSREGVDLSTAQGELELRRLQIAMIDGDQTTVDAISAQLDSLGDPYAKLAAGAIYEHAARDRERTPNDIATHRRIVRAGVALISHYGPANEALTNTSVAGLYSSVAASAAKVFELSGDTKMRDLAMRIDDQLLDTEHTSLDVLLRHATLAESANKAHIALDSWQTILNGAVNPSDLWFRARYETLRLLATIDPAKAFTIITQHKVLYPEFGPAPWDEKLRDLARDIEDRANAATPPTPDTEGTG